MMSDLRNLAEVLHSLMNSDHWHPEEARAVLRAGRALAREKGCPGLFDHLVAADTTPLQPSAA